MVKIVLQKRLIQRLAKEAQWVAPAEKANKNNFIWINIPLLRLFLLLLTHFQLDHKGVG